MVSTVLTFVSFGAFLLELLFNSNIPPRLLEVTPFCLNRAYIVSLWVVVYAFYILNMWRLSQEKLWYRCSKRPHPQEPEDNPLQSEA